MPQCSYHPQVETNVSCGECGRYICPKDMKSTPVGYKCPECARPAKGQYRYVKPRQMVYGALAGFAAALVGAWLLVVSGMGFFLFGVVWGMFVGEAVRRATGGHRGSTAATIGVVCVLLGGLMAGLDLLAVAMGVVGVISTLSWGWGR